MKILKYILGIIAVLAIVFLLLGFIKSEINYDSDILVEKSLAESWAVSQDEDKMSEWLDGFIRYEHISGTPGTVGAVSDVYFEQNGEESVIRETIKEIVPNESISMEFTSGFMDMDYKIGMSEENGKTKVSSSTTARGNGLISRSILALISGSLKDQEDTNLYKLRATIEKNTKNYFPVIAQE